MSLNALRLAGFRVPLGVPVHRPCSIAFPSALSLVRSPRCLLNTLGNAHKSQKTVGIHLVSECRPPLLFLKSPTLGLCRSSLNYTTRRGLFEKAAKKGVALALWRILPGGWKIAITTIPLLIGGMIYNAPLLGSVVLVAVGYGVYRILSTFKRIQRDLEQTFGLGSDSTSRRKPSEHIFSNRGETLGNGAAFGKLLNEVGGVFAALQNSGFAKHTRITDAMQDQIYRDSIGEIKAALPVSEHLQDILEVSQPDRLKFYQCDHLQVFDQYTQVSGEVSKHTLQVQMGYDVANDTCRENEVVANAMSFALVDEQNQVRVQRIVVTCLDTGDQTEISVHKSSSQTAQSPPSKGKVIDADWREVQ
ncbi:hypothetical protein IWQ61_010292 [Dispira simplex]|nr:hypothetical protein IWQ61_010292 [Dispira simplex]